MNNLHIFQYAQFGKIRGLRLDDNERARFNLGLFGSPTNCGILALMDRME